MGNIDFVSHGEVFYYDKNKYIGEMPNMHYHDHYEIYYLITGKRNHFVGDKFLTISQGDFVVVPPRVPHKTGGYKGVRAVIAFNGDFLRKWYTPNAEKELLSFFNKIFIRSESLKQSEILLILNKLEKAYQKGEENIIFEWLLRLFLILKDSPVAKAEQSAPVTLLNLAMEYTQKHYAEIESLDEVANALFISKYYLCHLFSKYLEISFYKYLTQIRLKNASEYLRDTKLSISEISQLCGFSTATYFCQVFKKEFGVSPLKYRLFTQNKK